MTALDWQAAYGTLPKPHIYDPMLEVLQERRAQREAAYIDHLRQAGHEIVVIAGRGIDEASIAKTLTAMRADAEVIVQAALNSNPFVGRTDVLRRVDIPSDLGAWSYEVIDIKLSRENKGSTVLQLCLYSDLVGQVQGRTPEFAFVVVPLSDFEPEVFRLSDYLAYYRSVRSQFISSLSEVKPTYPEPVGHSDACRWRRQCDDRRHADDHLSLVAGISATQRNELASQDVTTMAQLAALPLPLHWNPTRGAASSYELIREQARIQVEGRNSSKMLHEVMTIERERSAEWVVYLTMATALRDHLLDREDQRGSVFSWGWRPAMSWMLLFLWSWNGVILPVANATACTSIVPIPWEHLLGFAGLWLAIYGGGHTIKSVLGR